MEQCDPIGARLDRLPLSRFHFRIFGIISFSLLITGFLSYSGNVVLAKLVSNGWSNNYLNAAFTSALMFGYFIGSLTGGFMGDYLGRREAFRVNLLIVGISACAATFVPNMYWLILFRCLMGCGMGALIMVGYASFTEFIPPAVRGKWSARLSFVGNWSPMLSAAIGVVVIAFLSWRMMFLLGGAAMLLAWYLSGMYFIESPAGWPARGNDTRLKNTSGRWSRKSRKRKTSHCRPGRILPRWRSRARKAALSGCCLKVRCCGERWWRSRY